MKITDVAKVRDAYNREEEVPEEEEDEEEVPEEQEYIVNLTAPFTIHGTASSSVIVTATSEDQAEEIVQNWIAEDELDVGWLVYADERDAEVDECDAEVDSVEDA